MNANFIIIYFRREKNELLLPSFSVFVWQANILISSPHNRTFLRYNPVCHPSTCAINIALNFLVPDITSPSGDLSLHLAESMPIHLPSYLLFVLAQQRGDGFHLEDGCWMLSVPVWTESAALQPVLHRQQAARSVRSSLNPRCVYPACPGATETPFCTSLFIF